MKDLKGKVFGYVDSQSASGYLYARDMMKERGFNPDNMFKRTLFMGSHDKDYDVIRKIVL